MAPGALHFTASDEANRLLAVDPMALLVGFALDQACCPEAGDPVRAGDGN